MKKGDWRSHLLPALLGCWVVTESAPKIFNLEADSINHHLEGR